MIRRMAILNLLTLEGRDMPSAVPVASIDSRAGSGILKAAPEPSVGCYVGSANGGVWKAVETVEAAHDLGTSNIQKKHLATITHGPLT